MTKNAFDPALRVGYADYSWFANYNGNVMLHSAESARVRQTRIPEQPAPAEIGGFAIVTDPRLANAFANAGGMLVQAGVRGSTTLTNARDRTTLGVVRFGRVGWDSQLGPSDGVRSTTSGLGVSYAPTFLQSGSWVRLASVPERYEAFYNIHFTHPLLVRVSIDYVPKAGQTGPTFKDELIITPDGVLSTVSAPRRTSASPGRCSRTTAGRSRLPSRARSRRPRWSQAEMRRVSSPCSRPRRSPRTILPSAVVTET